MEAQKLRYKVAYYLLINSVLYKQGNSLPLLKCLVEEEAEYALRKSTKEYVRTIMLVDCFAHKVLR